MRIRHTPRQERPDKLQMSSMIDIVFLLLVFFVMTFTITAMEGDFHIDAAPRAKGPATPNKQPDVLPMHLRLTAHDDGSLKGIRGGQRRFRDFDDLHRFIMGLTAEHTDVESPLEGFVVDLDCDQHLDYRYVIDAITAVSGDLRPDGSRVDLIKEIRFR
jgi:biopolymer transport protein ExbD